MKHYILCSDVSLDDNCLNSYLDMELTQFGHVQQITHGAIQFTAYEELRKMVISFRTTESEQSQDFAANSLVSFWICNTSFLGRVFCVKCRQTYKNSYCCAFCFPKLHVCSSNLIQYIKLSIRNNVCHHSYKT